MVSTGTTGLSARLGLLQVCAAGVLWGTGGIVVTVLHERDGLGVMTVSAWRLALAAVTLIVLAAVAGRLRVARESARTEGWLIILVGCGTALYQGLYFGSVLLVGVSIATVVSLGLAPILAAVWEHLTARTRPARREVAVLAAALCGLVLISGAARLGPATPGGGSRPGLLLAVAAGATYAATTVLGHKMAQRVDAAALTTCATAVGAVALAPFLAVAAAMGQPVLVPRVSSLALLAYLGIATMALSYALLYAGLRSTSGSVATVATLVEPLSAALLAALLLGERLTGPAVVGGFSSWRPSSHCLPRRSIRLRPDSPSGRRADPCVRWVVGDAGVA